MVYKIYKWYIAILEKIGYNNNCKLIYKGGIIFYERSDW